MKSTIQIQFIETANVLPNNLIERHTHWSFFLAGSTFNQTFAGEERNNSADIHHSSTKDISFGVRPSGNVDSLAVIL